MGVGALPGGGADTAATPRPANPTPRSLAELCDLLTALTSLDLATRDPTVPRSAGADPTTCDDLGRVLLTGVAQDSRSVVAGDLYVARKGASTHGAAYARQAKEAGAIAALTDPTGAAECRAAGLRTLVVPDPQAVLGEVSAWTYGYPARHLTLFGVTGTNGKTTTTFLLDAGLRAAGMQTGLLGTVGARVKDQSIRSSRTTPEAPDVHALLALMREHGVTHVAMEVSSHALLYGRVDGMIFDVAGFTNLSQDHLELHGDMESYFATKARLFTPGHARRGVINLDDPYGRRLAESVATIPVVGYSSRGSADGLQERQEARRPRDAAEHTGGQHVGADWWATDIAFDVRGDASFVLHAPDGATHQVTLDLPGSYNVANAVLAAAMLAESGLDLPTVLPGLASASHPGRMERIWKGQDFVAIVDYAHTPDAIAAVVRAAREWTKGRVIVVFGCGGDRDPSKRPLMGEAAARYADVVVVTDDNPRSEDPREIRAAAIEGARRVSASSRAAIHDIGGRYEAIRWALESASAGDTVLVLGKGHEQGQEIDGVVHPFDDRLVVQEILSADVGQELT